MGVGTVGSSEAIMLAGLAFKRKWQNRRKAEGKPCDKPNIVTGANVQVWHTLYMYYKISFTFRLSMEVNHVGPVGLSILWQSFLQTAKLVGLLGLNSLGWDFNVKFDL